MQVFGATTKNADAEMLMQILGAKIQNQENRDADGDTECNNLESSKPSCSFS